MPTNPPVHVVRASNISFWSLLTLVFITLKLCGVINWAWWLVLLPALICFGLGAALLAIAGLCFGFARFLKWRISKLK